MIVLILPALILIGFIFGYPILRYIWISFHTSSVANGLIPQFNHGINWSRLINDARFWQDVLQTSRFAFVSVSLELVLAIAIALFLNQPFKGKGIIRAVSILPWALPTTIMALGWRWIFNSPYGPIDRIYNNLTGESLNLLSNPKITWIATVIADTWKTTPFIALIILAGLQTIPKDLYEAFELEGGTQFKALYKITLPMIIPYILISVVFRLAQAFGVFDLIQVMTSGGPAGSTESLGLYAYLNAMRFLDFGYSSTIMLGSFVLLIMGCLTVYCIFKMTKISIQK